MAEWEIIVEDGDLVVEFEKPGERQERMNPLENENSEIKSKSDKGILLSLPIPSIKNLFYYQGNCSLSLDRGVISSGL